jgi:hypothetical protein
MLPVAIPHPTSTRRKKKPTFRSALHLCDNLLCIKSKVRDSLIIDDRRVIQIILSRMINEKTAPPLYQMDDLCTDRRR